MSQYLIRPKKVEQLRVRVKDMSSSRAGDNIIKVLCMYIYPCNFVTYVVCFPKLSHIVCFICVVTGLPFYKTVVYDAFAYVFRVIS